MVNYKAQKQFRIFYRGDINIEHGGYFYSLEGIQWNYADFVRVTPCSDVDGPDNCYWIERGTVNIPEDMDRLKRALDCCGAFDKYGDATDAVRRHMAIDACLAYGYSDIDQTETVQIGAKQDDNGRSVTQVEKVLRGNTSLYRYARNVFKNGF